MKMLFRSSVIATAAVLAAFTFTTGAGLAIAGSSHEKAGYERCDGKESAMHSHGKASKAWKKTLTEEQRAQLKQLHADLQKELAPIRARIAEKKSEIRTVAAMLSRYQNMIKIRSLLTPEQKAAFDTAVMKHSGHVVEHKR